MNLRIACLGLGLALVPCAVLAADGLMPPPAETLWPRWQARITLQATDSSRISLIPHPDGGTIPPGFQGGAIFGDYFFARPWFGNFRATGGLMTVSQGGAPLAMVSPGPGMALNLGNPQYLQPGLDGPGTVGYLGLGYSSALWHSSLSITADVGLVTENPISATGVGRVLFGNQPADGPPRDMRMSGMVQLGVRYSF